MTNTTFEIIHSTLPDTKRILVEQSGVRAPEEEIDKPRSNCGIVGVYGHPVASTLVYYGLHALQHRGQEASGIASCYQGKNGTKHSNLRVHKAPGLVTEVFHDQNILQEHLIGDVAIGHNRYSTTGSNNLVNIQPFMVNYKDGQLAVAHNGNLTNTSELRDRLEEEGTIFQTSTDTEVLLHLTARSKAKTAHLRIMEALNTAKGAFSVLMLHGDTMIAARDPHGFRPLCLGKLDGAWVVASETCALDIIRAQYVRDVEPGEVLFFERSDDAVQEPIQYWLDEKPAQHRHCIFEFIYFSRPDSKIFSENVDKVRRKLGKVLAEESPVIPDGDEPVIVMSVPDSSNTASIGFVRTLQKKGHDVRFEIGLIRSHYIGRTFIQPGQEKRQMNVRLKFNTVKGVLKGRKVVVIDDSIVRGTTSKLLIDIIREAEPKELHVRITSPPITHPCVYGMDFPSRRELIAVQCDSDVEKIREELHADSLAYLSIEKMLSTVSCEGKKNYCTACFSGEYPIPMQSETRKDEHEV